MKHNYARRARRQTVNKLRREESIQEAEEEKMKFQPAGRGKSSCFSQLGPEATLFLLLPLPLVALAFQPLLPLLRPPLRPFEDTRCTPCPTSSTSSIVSAVGKGERGGGPAVGASVVVNMRHLCLYYLEAFLAQGGLE